MQYRRFGRIDFDVSILGFGAMRLPTRGAAENVDEKEATRMLHYAIDHGVNYFDTAYTYHGGESERFLGRSLDRRYRSKVKLATKIPTWLVNGTADFDRLFHEQLKRLNTEHIEFYLLHNLNKEHWSGLELLDGREQELIRHVRRQYNRLAPIPCTQCRYCLPCPHGVDIPQNLTCYNEGSMYRRPDLARRQYGFIPEKARSAACSLCRECEPKCPQTILISEWMPRVTEVLGKGKAYFV